MHATVVVVSEMQGHSRLQVRQLFTKSIREAGKSPHCHSHSKVLSLHKRRTDMFGIGITSSDFGYNPRDAWWGIPRIGSIELPVIAKHLRELREVYIRPKALRDGHGIVVQSVSRELHSV